jgi:hypothetical protein
LKSIDWVQAIGVLADVGVIAGIVFLALQISQGNELLQSEASIVHVEMRSGGIRETGRDREHLETLQKARDGEEASSVELLSLDFHCWSILVNWEWEYAQYEEGSLEILHHPPRLRWRPVVNYYTLLRDSWAKHKRTLSPEFVRYMAEQVLN